MGKSKKKKSSGSEDKPKKKKFKLPLLKILLFIGGAVVIAAFVKPDIVDHQPTEDAIVSIKKQLLGFVDTHKQPVVGSLASHQLDIKNIADKFSQGVVLGDQDIYLEDVVTNLQKILDAIPEGQVKRLKTDLCADVIQEAVNACIASNSAQIN